MTDSQFEELLAEAIKEHGGEYVDVREEMKKPHRFTRSFEKRMQKLIWKERGIRPPRKRLSLRMLIVVIVTAVIAVSSVMTVSAFREAIIGFITEVYEKFTNVQAQPDEDAPDTLEEIYEVTWVPEGFELIEDKQFGNQYEVFYSNDNDILIFRQYTLSDYSRNYDNERDDFEVVSVNTLDAFWFSTNVGDVLTWKNDKYVFELSTTKQINKETIIAIAKSVKKVEIR